MPIQDFITDNRNKIIIGSTAAVGLIITVVSNLTSPLPALQVRDSSGNKVWEVSTKGGMGVGNPLDFGDSGECLKSGGGSGNSMSYGSCGSGGGGNLSGSGASTQVAYFTGQRTLSGSRMFWDAANTRLGIGKSSPRTALEVNGTMSGSFAHISRNLSVSGGLVVNGAVRNKTTLDQIGAATFSNTATFNSTTQLNSATYVATAPATSVVFSNDAGYLEGDTGNFVWDNNTDQLAIGTSTFAAAEKLHLVSTTGTVPDVTSFYVDSFNYGNLGYNAQGYTHDWCIYAYRIIDGTYAYSTNANCIGATQDDSSANDYDIQLYWDDMSVDGYIIFKQDDFNNYNFYDAYLDVGNTTGFTDSNPGFNTGGYDVSNVTYAGNALYSEGTVEIISGTVKIPALASSTTVAVDSYGNFIAGASSFPASTITAGTTTVGVCSVNNILYNNATSFLGCDNDFRFISASNRLDVRGTISGALLTINGATTADNYIMGDLSLGKTTNKAKLDVRGSISGSTLRIGNAQITDRGNLILTGSGASSTVPAIYLQNGVNSTYNPRIVWDFTSSQQGISFWSKNGASSTEIMRLQDNGSVYVAAFGTIAGLNIYNYGMKRGNGTDGFIQFDGAGSPAVRLGGQSDQNYVGGTVRAEASAGTEEAFNARGATAQSVPIQIWTNVGGTTLSSMSQSGWLAIGKTGKAKAQTDIVGTLSGSTVTLSKGGAWVNGIPCFLASGQMGYYADLADFTSGTCHSF